MIPAFRPNTLAIVPNVSPVLINNVVYILPSGMYFLHLIKGGFHDVKKIVVH